ncbi:efflux RND transporter periplasmic adaptor subunit [Marininema halotolerans]|uniref:HlyD family secretion protein n=1 Tax=Marininema halotolerans TaxID=1155944 RepID=A0A1I6P7I3_9BACL|nr:efflux RND transporter periplasmic adaptor subunit [Marininema halotolerans]SFS36126.1 HlyD family secretion protein [Marininema halotolerans]
MNYKKIWIGTGICLLVGGMLTFSLLRTSHGETAVKLVSMEKKEFKETILTSGLLASEKEQNVYMQPGGSEVERLYVKPGDKVKKGDRLVKFKNMNQVDVEAVKLEVERARLSRVQLNDQLQTLKKSSPSPTANTGNDQHTQSGNIETPATEKELRNQLQLANLEYKQAQEKYRQAQEQLADLTVTSQHGGTVIRVNSGEPSQEGTGPMITVADLKKLKVSAEISEYDALKIKKDQRAIVRADALPDKKWSAQVTEVGMLPKDEKIGEGSQQIMYPVSISLNENASLKLGSRLMAEIILSSKKVNSLPVKAVIKKGKDHVFILKGEKAVKKRVKTGKTGEGRIAIISGITPSDRVIANPSPDLKDGAEVSVK